MFEGAERVKALYDAYVSVGFTEEQAYNFVILMMSSTLGINTRN
jgi:hypothetical protein